MRKGIIKMVLFAGGFFVLLNAVTQVLKPKWDLREHITIEPQTMISDGFYAQPKDSVDVIYLGSSHVYRNINPLVIYHEYGITGYNMASSIQRMWVSDYYLHEALKYQDPQVIVLDMWGIVNDGLADEFRNRKAFDYMRLSFEKLRFVRESMNEDENFYSYLWPIMKYHGRYAELDSNDFDYIRADRNMITKGHDVQCSVQAQAFDYWNTDETLPVVERSRSYLDDIVQTCRDEGITLLLIKTPSGDWTKGYHKWCEKYAEEKNLTFVDYNENFEMTGLDMAKDYADICHMNETGARKFSLCIGKLVWQTGANNEEVLFYDKRADERFYSWGQDYEKFSRIEKVTEIAEITSTDEYAKACGSADICILVVDSESGEIEVIDKGEKNIYHGSFLAYKDSKPVIRVDVGDGRTNVNFNEKKYYRNMTGKVMISCDWRNEEIYEVSTVENEQLIRIEK